MQSTTPVLAVGLFILLTLSPPAACGPAGSDRQHNEPSSEAPTEFLQEEVGEQLEETDSESPIVVGELSEEKESSEFFLQEVREQLEGRTDEVNIREDRETHDHRDIYHGSTIALRYRNNRWLGCSLSQCGAAGCPRAFMDGSDWENCWGEVFRIYRALGPGTIRVGDLVGLYYPRENKWFTCPEAFCTKSSCPGSPTTTHGFANQERWYTCNGEVFKIYARGKLLGDTITEYDYIFLYHLQEHNWVTVYVPDGSSRNHHRTCPGNTRPPSNWSYDDCGAASSQIFKQ